jgi:hypothetical protein
MRATSAFPRTDADRCGRNEDPADILLLFSATAIGKSRCRRPSGPRSR